MLENMSKTSSMSLLSLCLLLLYLFQAKCLERLALALYIFGDSLTDSGNNDFLNTLAKANYEPYGIDFPAGPTGRFTNGRTSVDFLAQFLGLPFAPPYMGLSVVQKYRTITGINFASAAAGILQESGTGAGMILALPVQIELFRGMVNRYLPRNFRTHNELLQYLSKSIFVVNIGSNDYLNNYLQPTQYNRSSLYTPVQFACILLKELQQHLQDLYNLGVRKFLVFNIPPIGCLPGTKILKNITSGCAEDENQLVSFFNRGLPIMLQEISTSLQGSTFVHADSYTINYALNQNYTKYGFTTANPCCVTNSSTIACLKDVPPCKNRTTHIYWDDVYPTQQVNLLVTAACFDGPTPCTPINVLHLALKQQGSASQ